MKPYIFQLPDLLGGRPLFSYGVMLGISFLCGWSLCVYQCRRDGMSGRVASMTMFVIVVSSLLGARALHFVSSPTAKLTLTNFFKYDEGGLVAYGGIVAALLGAYFYNRYRRHDGWVFLDNAAAPVALGLGITRIGCFLFGCDYGVRSETMWAVRFPRWDNPDVVAWIKRSAPAFVDHTKGVLHHAAVMSDSVHPTQLYESLVGFVAFGVLLVLKPLKRFHGQIMLAFVAYYAIARYAIENLRGDADRGSDVAGLGISTSQLIGVVLLVAVGVLWWMQSKKGLYAAQGTAAWGPATATDPPPPSASPSRKQTKRKKKKKK